MESRTTTRIARRRVLAGALALGGLGLLAACAPAQAPAGGATGKPADAKPAAGQQQAPAKTGQPYAGTTLKMMMVTHAYGQGLTDKLGELEQKTGLKVEIDQMAFPVLNQRADLELSSSSGAYDVMQMIFIRSGRWIGAGWAEPLNGLIDNPSRTDKQELALDDFLPGAIAPFKKGNDIFALPWLADSTVVGYRTDVWEKAGFSKYPATYEALLEAAPKVHAAEAAAFVTSDNMHWIWPNWLISNGGSFFAKAPDDLRPTFDTPEAIKAAEMFGTMVSKYAPPGSPKIETTLAQTLMQQGKATSYLDGMGNVQQIINREKTQLADQMAFTDTPSGTKGHFPQLAVHGFMINKASKKKEAAWELVKWAASKDMMTWMALNKGHLAGTRASMLSNPEVKQKFNHRGSDLPALCQKVMQQAGAGYMAFRTVPQFPPIGDRVTIAIQNIASGQETPEAAMKALQRDAEGMLEKEGVKVR